MKEILLTLGQFALVDNEDFDWLNQYKWFAHKNGRTYYAQRGLDNGKQMIRMHNIIMKAPEGMEIDHKDSNGLNNQKYNFRFATHKQNCANRQKAKNKSSEYKGVTWSKEAKKWRAQMVINKKMKFLGYFDIEQEAAKAYDEFALRHFGEFAKLNFLS